jgi:diguanylate cyclase (GGDEF)-like protein
MLVETIHRGPQAEPDLPAQERAAVLLALLEASARVAAGTTLDAVLRDACDGLAHASPHIRLAWIWVGARDAAQIRPLAFSGFGKRFAESLVIDKDRQSILGAACIALLRANGDADASLLSSFVPWQAAALRFDFHEVGALPLQLGHKRDGGIIVLYSDLPGYFSAVGLGAFRAFARCCEAALSQSRVREELQRRTTVDTLTGLQNRAAMREAMSRAHSQARRYERSFSLVMLDLDNLKTVNDVHGHEVGDRLLQAVAAAAKAALRESDAIARWGGDEFLCLLPETDPEAARQVAERLRQDVAALEVEAGQVSIAGSASVGVASFPKDGATLHELLKVADRALYQAKANGRNGVAAAGDLPLLN